MMRWCRVHQEVVRHGKKESGVASPAPPEGVKVRKEGVLGSVGDPSWSQVR